MIQLKIGGQDVTEAIVPPIALEDDVTTGPVSMNVTLARVANLSVESGNIVTLYINQKLWFLGFVFEWKNTSDSKKEVTAYDPIKYFLKDKDDFAFVKKTPTQVIQFLCNKYGVKIGNIVNIPIVFPTLYFRGDKNLYEVIITVLTEAKKKTGQKYWVRFDNGLQVFEKVPPQKVIVLGSGLESSEYGESIEEMYNRVRIVNRENNISVVAEDKTSQAKYGMMTTLEEYGAKTKAEALAYAKKKLAEMNKVAKTMSITHVHGLGEQRFWCGDYVYVADPTVTIAANGYYFKKVSYEIHRNYVRLSGELSFTDDLPIIEYEAPEEKKSSNSGGKNSGKGYNSKAAKAVREKVKEMGLTITSSRRSAKKNAEVGGSKTSYHLKGQAYDVAGPKAKLDQFAAWARNSGLFRKVLWQVKGHYDHVHVDWD
ncbi:D-Ala-D-Ala carboxypeptidase family metallohydrolase [Aneurinibacillus thermoaerophilus]|uniref:XkdQ/YqbQ family protein n=1 Tax=Aneurinibacillus thermoaerophilus TaxID=143495 RepID=UPI002E1F2BAC|nr:D-Ala-D-Ala carboxypeptidase family metallohydrolase [Aneurinibacillus thermoaerophilus]MED0766336.1 D-Ala-D-Ala carboxypeptidase family metallohydrolase [Aneurinibacillus thermoaerophilus]